MKPASRIAPALAAFVAAWIAPDTAAAAEPESRTRLGALGNDRVLWVYRSDPSPDGGRLLRSAYRVVRPGRARAYGAGQTVVGDVARTAVRGQNLHVFFEDGTHRRFAPGVAGALSASGPRVFTEVNLPGAVVPRALADDMAQDGLYAIVPATVAAKVADEQAARMRAPDDSSGAADVDPDASIGPTTSPAVPTITFESSIGVVRYSQGQWVADRDGPREVGDETRIVALVAHEGRLHLFVRAAEANAGLLHQWSRGGEDDPAVRWSDPSAVAGSAGKQFITGSWLGDSLLIVLAGQDEAGPGLETVRLVDSRWVAGPRIPDAPVASGMPWAATVFDDKLAVARLTERGDVEVQLLTLPAGELAEPGHLVPQLISTSGVLSPWTRQIVQYSLLTIILIAVFFWRRDCITFMAPLPPEQAFARLSRRGVAFLIDLVITAPVWAPGVYRLWRSVAPGLTPTEQLSAPTGTGSDILFWSWALVGAVLAVYGALFELAIGATAGKRITGCFVVDEFGQRGRPTAVVVRNLVRVLEFHFPALVLLVLFTPSRQRLGDVLARTIVAEAVTPVRDPGSLLPGDDDQSPGDQNGAT